MRRLPARYLSRMYLPVPDLRVGTLAGFFCLLVLLVMQAIAEQPGVVAKEANQPRSRGTEEMLRQHPGQEQRTATLPGSGKEHGGQVPASKPFISPIAPMSPLFANDDLLRIPWASFGFHPRPVRFHTRLALATRQVRFKPPDPHSGFLTSNISTDNLPSLARLVSDRVMPTSPRASSAFPESFPSGAIPQTGISPERATQIQVALARYGYLPGTPTGSWDAPSIAAMRRLQSDHRWQTKFMPDARALIFLGLGPRSESP